MVPSDAAAALADLYVVERRVKEIDGQILDTRRILDGAPSAAEPRPRRVIAQSRRDDLARQLREAELQEQTERARARTHERQLYSGTIHSPRELSQLAGELEQLKGRLALEEVAEMALLSALDEADFELQAALEEATEARRALERHETALDDARAQAADQRGRISAAHLHLYDRVMAHRPPPPVVEVRNGTCTGCRLPLTTSQARALRLASEPLTCETCGRILLLV